MPVLIQGRPLEETNDNFTKDLIHNVYHNPNHLFTYKTSGTTGIPKDVEISGETLLEAARAAVNMFSIDHSTIAYHIMPRTTIAYPTLIVLPALETNSTVYIERFQGNQWIEQMQEIQPDVTIITPYLWKMYQPNKRWKTLTFKDNARVVVGSDFVSAAMVDDIKSKGNNVQVLQCYGTTEIPPPVYVSNHHKYINGWAPSILYDIKNDGELYARWSTQADYLMPTGDIVRNEGDNIFLAGRKHHVFKFKDKLIFPEQIENIANHYGALGSLCRLENGKITLYVEIHAEGKNPFGYQDFYTEDFNVKQFKEDAKQYLQSINVHVNVPITVVPVSRLQRNHLNKIVRDQEIC